MRATHDDSGWKTEEPRPAIAAANKIMIAAGDRQHQQAHQAASHSDGQPVRRWSFVGHHAADRLQQRGGHLERQRDQSVLAEIELI
jgi:hypothetical protein